MTNKSLYTVYYDEKGLCMSSYKNGERRYMDKDYCEAWMKNVSRYPISKIEVFDDDINLIYERAIVRIAGFSRFMKDYQTSLLGLKIIDAFSEQRQSLPIQKKVQRKNKYSNLDIFIASTAVVSILASGISLAKKKNNIPEDPTIGYYETVSDKKDTTLAYDFETSDVPTETTTKLETTTQEETTVEFTTEPETTQEETHEETTLEETSKIDEPSLERNASYSYSGYNYRNDPADGFIVTTGNKTYSISDEDFDLMCAVVMHEGGENPNEALAVASVMLNRCDSGAWGGTTPRSVITAKGQFESYFEGYYRQYLNGRAPDSVKMAVRDALNGVRNNEYESFRADFCTSYSDNMITSNGNRYR